MKKGWVMKPLGDVFETVTGNTPSKSNTEYYGRHIPLVKPPELQDCELSDAEDGLSEEGARVARVAPPSSILVSCIGNLGKIGFNTVPVAFNQQINAIIPDRNHAIPEFFFYQVLSCRFRDQLESLASGTTVSIVNKSRFNSIEIVLPPLAEQQRIVGLLDEAFGGLATAQCHAAQNLQNARDLFESHLNAVFTQRGEGWQLRRIPDVCVTFGRGKSRHRPRNEPCLYGGRYPFIQTGDISNADHVITTHTQTYNETGLAQSKLWPKGTVGIAIVGATIGETGVLDFEACFPDSVIGMTVNPAEADPFFLEYMLQHFKKMVKSHGEGSARENINLATFDRVLFPMPSVNEQRQIAAATDALKDQTKRLESIYQRKLAAIDELKKSLLHQAFSGEL